MTRPIDLIRKRKTGKITIVMPPKDYDNFITLQQKLGFPHYVDVVKYLVKKELGVDLDSNNNNNNNNRQIKYVKSESEMKE